MSISTEYRAVIASSLPDRDPDLVNRQIDEVVKFLSIISTNQGRFIPLTQASDEVWHEMIVQTRLYMQFCEQLPGARYIHHESIGMGDYSARVGHENSIRQFIGWIPDYVGTYGPFTPEAAEEWAVVQFLKAELGMSLEQINALGEAEAAARTSGS